VDKEELSKFWTSFSSRSCSRNF